jgi:hypothetical protein
MSELDNHLSQLEVQPEAEPRHRRIVRYIPVFIWFASFLGVVFVLYSNWAWFISPIIAKLETIFPDESQPVSGTPLIALMITMAGAVVSALGTVTTMILAIRRDQRESREAKETHGSKKRKKR